MTYFALIKKTSVLIFTALLLSGGFGVVSPQQAAAVGTNLCHDAFAGVTYDCPKTATEKVDNKAPGKFSTSKCYVFSDPNKGWQVLPCTDGRFTTTTTIPQATRKSDSALTEACPDEIEEAAVKEAKERGTSTTKAKAEACDLIARYANPLITFLTVAVGLVVTISIVIGGIQYATARNNPQAISAAKTRITNALLGFLAYSLLWGFLQWVVPGGFLSS